MRYKPILKIIPENSVMKWRQYDSLYDDLKNVAFKITLAPSLEKLIHLKCLIKPIYYLKGLSFAAAPEVV